MVLLVRRTTACLSKFICLIQVENRVGLFLTLMIKNYDRVLKVFVIAQPLNLFPLQPHRQISAFFQLERKLYSFIFWGLLKEMKYMKAIKNFKTYHILGAAWASKKRFY